MGELCEDCLRGPESGWVDAPPESPRHYSAWVLAVASVTIAAWFFAFSWLVTSHTESDPVGDAILWIVAIAGSLAVPVLLWRSNGGSADRRA